MGYTPKRSSEVPSRQTLYHCNILPGTSHDDSRLFSCDSTRNEPVKKTRMGKIKDGPPLKSLGAVQILRFCPKSGGGATYLRGDTRKPTEAYLDAYSFHSTNFDKGAAGPRTVSPERTSCDASDCAANSGSSSDALRMNVVGSRRNIGIKKSKI